MDLRAQVCGIGTIADVAAQLDNLAEPERWEALSTLTKREQRTLYLKAEASAPVTRADFVANVGMPVVHEGRNSLPLFRRFQKHMVLREDGRIWGFNEGRTRRLVGPGYFEVRACVGDETTRSAWVVDYFRVPESTPGEGWPVVRGNARLLSFFVYHHTRDYLRRVTDGVLVGSAYKTIFGRERRLDSYFVLMRR